MAGNLVTIATFDQPAKARLAQNELEAAGIKSAVADENTITMDWLLGAAIGWVKLQVLEEDAERAVAVLEEALGAGDDPVDPESLAAQAEAAPPEDGKDHSVPVAIAKVQTSAAGAELAAPAEAESPLTERDEYARRFFLAAIFGLVIPILWFYAIYLFLNTAFGEGSLNAQSRFKLRFGGVLLCIGFFMAFLLFRFYGDPFP